MKKYLLPSLAVVVLMLAFPLYTVAVVTLLCSTVAWGVFVTWYSVRARWWETPYGRNVMGTGTGIFALLLAFCIALLYGRFPGDLALWTLAFLNLGIMAVHRTYHMEKVQRGVSQWKTRQRSAGHD